MSSRYLRHCPHCMRVFATVTCLRVATAQACGLQVSLTQRQMGNKSYVLRASSTFELEAWLEAMQAAAAEELPKPVAIRTARCL